MFRPVPKFDIQQYTVYFSIYLEARLVTKFCIRPGNPYMIKGHLLRPYTKLDILQDTGYLSKYLYIREDADTKF